MDIIERIQSLCEQNSLLLTKHASYRLEERGIEFVDIKTAILHGEVIENYPTDFPYPSVLILGYTRNKMPIHIVIGIGYNCVQLITAYFPSSHKWNDDMKTRKVVQPQ